MSSAQTSLSPASPASQGRRRRAERTGPKVKRACDYCKTKKLKCSGTVPCAGCVERRLHCAYATAYRRGRAPTPAPAPASGLDLDRDLGSQPDIGTEQDDGPLIDPISNLGFLHRAWARLGLGSSSRVHSEQRQHDQRQQQPQPLVSAGDAPFDRVHSTDSAASTPVLPGRAQLLDLVGFYFEHCVVTYRCLDQMTVMDWVEVLASNVEAGRAWHHSIGHAAAAVVVTILAIAALRRSRKNNGKHKSKDDDNSRGDVFFCAAVCLTDDEVGPPTLHSAQARVLQVLYLLQTARMNQAWHVFGSLFPITSMLGLHRRSRLLDGSCHDRDQDWDRHMVDQFRRRTFWTAYTIDKYLAVVLGRPRLYHDDDIDQDLPDRINNDNTAASDDGGAGADADCYIDSLIAHATLARLIGRVSREVYSLSNTVHERDRLAAAHRLSCDLHAWHAALPVHLGAVRVMSLIPPLRRQALALRLAYCHAIIHANRPFLLAATKLSASQYQHISIVVSRAHQTADIGRSSSSSSSSAMSLLDSVSECLAAAKVAMELVNSMANSDQGSLLHAFWWTPYATFCALAVVYVWQIQQQQQGMSQHGLEDLIASAQRCHTYLYTNTTDSTDAPSYRYAVILEELRNEAELQRQRRLATASATAPQTAATIRGQSHSLRTSQCIAVDNNDSHHQPILQQNHSEIFIGDLPDPLPFNTTVSNDTVQEDILMAAVTNTNTIFDGWQTMDWMDLDSSAFGPHPDLNMDAGDSTPLAMIMPTLLNENQSQF